MSYAIDLLFKNLKKAELNDFILKFKNKVREEDSITEILKKNLPYCPCSFLGNYKEEKGYIVQRLVEGWLIQLFSTKFIYLEKYNLLVVVNYPYKCIRPLFDGYLYAQNSTDQDYSYETWNGIPIFEKIRDKYINAQPEDLPGFDYKFDEITPEALDYARKATIFTVIFEEILDPVVWNYHKQAFYVSCIFGTYEVTQYRGKIEDMVIVEALKTIMPNISETPENEWLDRLSSVYPKYIAERILKRWKNGERYD